MGENAPMTWTPVEGTLGEMLAQIARPFEALAAGQIPAVVLRRAFPSEQCRLSVHLHPVERSKTRP